MKEIESDPCVLSRVNSVFPGCTVPLQPYQHALHTETDPRQCWRDPPPRAPLLAACRFPTAVPAGLTLLPLLGKVIRAVILNRLWRELTKDIKEEVPGLYLCTSFKAEQSLTSITKIWEAHPQKVLDFHFAAVRVSGTVCNEE